MSVFPTTRGGSSLMLCRTLRMFIHGAIVMTVLGSEASSAEVRQAQSSPLYPEVWAVMLKSYQEKAEAGDPVAQKELGMALATGYGVPQDLVEGYKWISLGAARGSEAQRREWGKERDRLRTFMTATDIAEAETRVRSWVEAFEKRKK